MNRIGIFAFYDKDGIVDPCFSIMLRDIRKELDYFVVAINGIVTTDGEKELRKYADEIIFRENVGFDAGAYKDAIAKLDDSGKLRVADELFLFNCTFFGFFYPIEDMLNKCNTGYSFYGMTEHPRGETANRIPFQHHIQSYFLLLRKDILDSKAFFDFWNEMQYPDNYEEAIINFEVRFTSYFEVHGFKGHAVYGIDNATDQNSINPLMKYPDTLVSDEKLPILKIKTLSFMNISNYDRVKRTMSYIEKNNLYDIKMIWAYIDRIYPYMKKLYEFCKAKRVVYIYGAGEYGKGIRYYLETREIKNIIFVVSDTKGEKESDGIIIKQFCGELSIDRAVIIIAMKKEFADEVINNVERVFTKEAIMRWDASKK
jgi:lipopolysaccharide biosynthesis protein